MIAIINPLHGVSHLLKLSPFLVQNCAVIKNTVRLLLFFLLKRWFHVSVTRVCSRPILIVNCNKWNYSWVSSVEYDLRHYVLAWARFNTGLTILSSHRVYCAINYGFYFCVFGIDFSAWEMKLILINFQNEKSNLNKALDSLVWHNYVVNSFVCSFVCMRIF